MPSKLILDPTEPGVNEVVAGMVVGEPIVLREVTIVPTLVDPNSVEADITAIAVEGAEGEGEPIPPGEPGGPAVVPDAALTDMPRENEGGFDEGQM